MSYGFEIVAYCPTFGFLPPRSPRAGCARGTPRAGAMHGQRAYRSAGGAPRSPARALWEAGRQWPAGLSTPGVELIEWRWAAGNGASRPVAERAGYLVAATPRRAADRGTRADGCGRLTALRGPSAPPAGGHAGRPRSPGRLAQHRLTAGPPP